MHREILNFFKLCKEHRPELFKGVKVLEAGSLDINGSVREFFEDDCEYVGVDAKQGKGVDWWGLFHEYDEKPDGYFDVCVSTETLEHDPFWRLSIYKMLRKIRRGGSIVISCAGTGRSPHGVKFYQDPDNPEYTRPDYHPLGPEREYYWNIRPELLLYELLSISSFSKLFYYNYRNDQDLCLIAIGKEKRNINYSRGQVAVLRKYEKTKV